MFFFGKHIIRQIFFICLLGLVSTQAQGEANHSILIGTPKLDFFYKKNASYEEDGLISKIIRTAFKSQNMAVSFQSLPWKRSIFEVETGNLAGAFTSQDIGWHKEKFIISDAIIHRDVILVLNNSYAHLDIKTYADLGQLDIAVIQGDNLEHELSGRGIPYKTIAFSYRLYDLIDRGRIDGVLGFKDILEPSLMSNGNPNSVSVITIEKHPIFFMVSRKNPKGEDIIEKLNNGLKMMKENNTYDAILNAYFKTH
ncbi:exported hypothetical protein [Candidatus Terasakiella magnetica]|uniref:Solute-binding protein family 3/N-terminal domain-containing protein n=1 Tax=Candidatus Terasakiella magnetica TaxID=1867952 RepID=A0A1C3RD37_9PROT|nr:transporter substrate-binding domain-containing protein [Candidatus Terasakiella magnetica]SCA55151.1 exported hypothetical protein [Candidatus Terasakiella magnetica]